MYSSTGVAEKAVRVEVSRSMVLAGTKEWKLLDTIGEETAAVAEKVSVNVLQHTPTIAKENKVVGAIKLMVERIKKIRKPRAINPGCSFYESSNSVSPFGVIESSSTAAVATIDASLDESYSGETVVTHKKYDNVWTHYMSDIGGQPEFQELFPNLIFGPSFFYYVFRADQNLYCKFPVEYLHSSGESMVPFEANITNREAILQFLASIASLGVLSKPEGKSGPLPRVLFIATHIDRLKSEDEIANIDQELQKIVKGTQAYRDGIIVFGSESRMLLAVNNLAEDDTDFQKVRSVVERVVTGNDDYLINVPYTWSLFSVTIQHHPDPVIAYETCLEVGRECGITTPEEMNHCLWFLHHQTGTLRFFNDVPEVRGVVFKDPQFLYDSVSDLVIHTFTFEKTRGDKVAVDDFSKKGIFTLTSLKILTADKTNLLSSSQLIKLLEHLRIVAPLQEDRYFLPCSLVHADIQRNSSTPSFPSFVVAFECGYCPKGLFGALIADLLQSNVKGCYEWKFKEDHIFRNLICFAVGPYLDKFQFSLAPTHITIDVFPTEIGSRSPSLASMCHHVQQHFSRSIVRITERLNYNVKKAAHQLAFLCPSTTCHTASHPAIISFNKKVPCVLDCPYSRQTLPLPEGCEVWFSTVSS